MNDNAELLKFAVENIEEWPEEWTHLRSDDLSSSPILTVEGNWFIDADGSWVCKGDGYEKMSRFKTKTPQVISRKDWEEARKEYTIQLTEEGAKRVFDGLENPPPTNPKLLEAAKNKSNINPYTISPKPSATKNYTYDDTKPNTFTKSMLEAGKHVIYAKHRDRSNYFIWLTNAVAFNLSSFNTVPQCEICFEDVEKVYEAGIFSEGRSIKLVWSREDEEKKKEREMLKKEIDSLKAQLKEKEEELRCKTQYLEELK